MRWIITLVAVAALVSAGLAVTASGGEEKKKVKGADLTALTCPQARGGSAPANAFDTKELIGLRLADARAKASGHGCTIVVSLEDGEGKPVPITLDPKRIYVYTEKGAVTQIEGVGGGI
jgi:hypothetical protein